MSGCMYLHLWTAIYVCGSISSHQGLESVAFTMEQTPWPSIEDLCPRHNSIRRPYRPGETVVGQQGESCGAAEARVLYS